MKKILLSIIVFVATAGHAQQFTYSNVWTNQSFFLPFYREPIELDDGSFVSSLAFSLGFTHVIVGLLRFDAQGNYMNHKLLWFNEPLWRQHSNVCKISNNSFVFTGNVNTNGSLYSDLWFTKWDASLDTVLTKKHSFDNIKVGFPRWTAIDSSKNILATSAMIPELSSTLANNALFKLDTLGNLLWYRNYFSEQFNTPGSLYKSVPYFKDHYLLGGVFMDNTIHRKLFIIKTDINGEFIKEFSYRFPSPVEYPNLSYMTIPKNIIIDNDSNIYVLGASMRHIENVENSLWNRFIIKLNNQLDVVFTKLFATSINEDFQSSTILNNKIYAVVKKFVPNMTGNGFDEYHGIICFDSDGNILWHKISPSRINEMHTITTTADQMLVITGFHADYTFPEQRNWILKMDEYGCIASDCDFLTLEDVPVQTQLTAYPNPVQEVLNIKSSLPFPTHATWQLFDAMGRILKTAYLPAAEQLHAIDVRDLAAGLYYIRMQAQGRNWAHIKFLKQ